MSLPVRFVRDDDSSKRAPEKRNGSGVYNVETVVKVSNGPQLDDLLANEESHINDPYEKRDRNRPSP